MKFSDLTKDQVQEICEAFAKREGWMYVPSKDFDWFKHELTGEMKLSGSFKYPTDLNAMHRILEGMDDKTGYAIELIRVIENDLLATRGFTIREPLPGWHPQEVELMLCATAQQQFVAAAMALGILKEGLV